MITLQQLEAGLASYIDDEILPCFGQDGFARVATASVFTLIVKKQKSLVVKAMEHPVVQMLELFDAEGNMDVDAVYEAVIENVPAAGFKVTVPILGTEMIFRKSDIDKLYSYLTRES